MSVIAEILNEGLPRAAWTTIGDSSSRTLLQRLSLTHTLLLAQSTLGLILSLCLFGSAHTFAKGFVPDEVRERSIIYVRISAFSALSSAVETAISSSTRALDKPDVPFILSMGKFIVNIILDMLLISTFHVGHHKPTVNLQAIIQLTCNLSSVLISLLYFLFMYSKPHLARPAAPSMSSLAILIRPGIITMVESLVRNALYLWIIHTIVRLGSIHATAWGVFTTIRWGLVMVPVAALEATTLAFVGHNWARWRQDVGTQTLQPVVSFKTLYAIAKPAATSVCIALLFEIPLCIVMSIFGARSFAKYLSGSDEVASVAAHMWRTIDWCYIMYAVYIQLAAVLLATRPKWYLWQSLGSNFLYVLPWAIVCQVKTIDPRDAWKNHAFNFGGSLVFSFFWVPMVLGAFAWSLMKGNHG